MEEVVVEKEKEVKIESKKTSKDYSLVGPNSVKALQNGLAEATWYQPPVPREKMRKLLVRKNGPAIRDTLIWFGLLFGFGYGIYALWGTWWVIIPIILYSVVYGLVLRFAMARDKPRHGFQE